MPQTLPSQAKARTSGLATPSDIDAAVKQLAADGLPVTDELLARLSPLQYDHINFLGHYAFTWTTTPGLRQLRDPQSHDGTEDIEDE